jgi:hypothetical protein
VWWADRLFRLNAVTDQCLAKDQLRLNPRQAKKLKVHRNFYSIKLLDP